MAKRILIIDDQPFMIKLIQYNLDKNGYQTFTETNGLIALAKIDEIAPDLVLLDIRMPHISGTELCAKLRKKKIMLDVPIIILTGQLKNDVEPIAKAAGATDLMTKPFSPLELISKIKDMLAE